MKHLCHYCKQELGDKKALVTFYFKECANCSATYHFNWSDKVTMISLDLKIRDKRYSVSHDVEENRVRVLFWPEREIEWNGNSGTMKILPDRLLEFDGDHHSITPTNIREKLETVLTFL
jgi:hypothetical protein